MWLATATDGIFPVLIEVETPAKRWFTASGQPRAEWTQARAQLVSWKQWLKRPENLSVFRNLYGISGRFKDFEIHPQFVLVYGRRREFQERFEMRGARANQQGPDEYHVTFDRPGPDFKAQDFLTLRIEGTRVAALVIPPTVRLGPDIAPLWLDVANRPEAALRESRMSPERRRFVADRFAYWDEWARGFPSGRSYRLSDSE
jgi:hypothetical protein